MNEFKIDAETGTNLINPQIDLIINDTNFTELMPLIAGNSSIDKVELLEREMAKQPQVDLPLEHIFAPGIYCRQLKIPKGVLLTGKIHKHKHLAILLKGQAKVLIDGEIQDIQAPFMILSPSGTKRIIEALKDCILMTIHATNETNIDKLEDDLVVLTKEEYLEYINQEPLIPGLLECTV